MLVVTYGERHLLRDLLYVGVVVVVQPRVQLRCSAKPPPLPPPPPMLCPAEMGAGVQEERHREGRANSHSASSSVT